MAEIVLKVKEREKTGSRALDRSRKQGLIPAIMYGHGNEPQTLWVNYIEFNRVYREAGESSILSLVQEKGKPANVIVHDVQLDPLKSRFSHIDFFQVRMDEALETHVPLEFVGESPAVREQGGILVKPIEEVLISCLPKDLPRSLSVDLSKIKTFDDHIQLEDIELPPGVTIMIDPLTTLALVEPPRTEAEMAALDEKIEGDVTKVEGVVKEEATPEGEAAAPAEGTSAAPASTEKQEKK